MIDLPSHTAAEVDRAFTHSSDARAAICKENGARSPSRERDWCASVYATTQRQPGKGIL